MQLQSYIILMHNRIPLIKVVIIKWLRSIDKGLITKEDRIAWIHYTWDCSQQFSSGSHFCPHLHGFCPLWTWFGSHTIRPEVVSVQKEFNKVQSLLTVLPV